MSAAASASCNGVRFPWAEATGSGVGGASEAGGVTGGESSGSMNLARVDGRLVFRGIVITTGPWRDPKFAGAPYDEAKGSVTTALGTDAAILKAGRELVR